MGKENFWIKILRLLGIIRQYDLFETEINHECRKASKICDHHCDNCVWHKTINDFHPITFFTRGKSSYYTMDKNKE